MGLHTMVTVAVLLGGLCLGPAPSGAGQPDQTTEALVDALHKLDLGAGDYLVGSTLTATQVQLAQTHLVADTYPGTIKFAGGDFFVVADEKKHLILAIYQRLENIGREEVQQMVSHLMTRFGEPTTTPHSGLIYWAYNEAGKIASSSFSEAKVAGNLDIIATVKFSSSLDLDGPRDDNVEETGSIYYIITSDRLLNLYITDR